VSSRFPSTFATRAGAQKTSALGSVLLRKLRPESPGRSLIEQGTYGTSLPMPERVDLVQQGTERVLTQDRRAEVGREALESAATGLALGSALTAAPALAEKALTLGVTRANKRATVTAADALYDALSSSGGAFHQGAVGIGGDALSPQDSAKVLERLGRAHGIAYVPRANSHYLAAGADELARPFMGAVDALVGKMGQGGYPSASEVGDVRAQWRGSARAKVLDADLPGWDRPQTLDRQDFRNIAKAISAKQGEDAVGARSQLISMFRNELVQAEQAGGGAGPQARRALELGDPRLGRALEADFPGMRQVRAARGFLSAPMPGTPQLTQRFSALRELASTPLGRRLFTRGTALVPLVGLGAGLYGGAIRKRALRQLETAPRSAGDIEESLRKKDESTALALGRMFGDATPVERALGATQRATVSPGAVSDVAETALMLSPYILGG
jgi:hypothetical protein